MDLGGKDFFDARLGLGHQRAFIEHPGRVDHRVDRAELGPGCLDSAGHFRAVADIGHRREHLGAQLLELFDRMDTLRDLGLPTGAAQIVRPVLAWRQVRAPQKRQIDRARLGQRLGHAEPDAAKAAGDEPGHARTDAKLIGRGFRRRRHRQGQAAITLLEPTLPAQRDNCIAGLGQKILEDLICHPVQHRLLTAQHPLGPFRHAAGLGPGEIDQSHGHAGQLARDHLHRTKGRGLFRIGQRLVMDLHCTRGQHRDVDRSGQPGLADRLTEEHQTVEPAFLHIVEEARARPEAFLAIGEPAMDDPAGHNALGDQILDQRIIAVAPALGRQRIALGRVLHEGVALMDLDHGLARAFQAGRQPLAKPCRVHEDQPGLARFARELFFGIDLAGRGCRQPGRAPTPIGDVVMALDLQPRIGPGLARRDEVILTLEGIGRQRHTPPRGHPVLRLAPDSRPVRLEPKRPEPPQRREEETVIGNGIFGMAQRVERPRRGHLAMRLDQRGQGRARSAFQEDAPRRGGQRRDTIGKAHGVAQVLGPVAGIGRLLRRQGLPGAVRNDRNGRRAEINPVEISPEAIQNWCEHPRMGGDVDGDAPVFDPVLLEPVGKTVQRRRRTGGHRQLRRVDPREIEIFGLEIGLQRLRRQLDRDHAARRDRIEERAAQMHEADHVFKAHHARQTGGDVLAHGMPGQSCGLHAPGHPELGQRIFDNGDQRQLHRGLGELGIGRLFLAFCRQPKRTDVIGDMRLERCQPLVHPVAEDRLGLIEIARHARVLRTAAGEQEHCLRHIAGRVIHRLVGEDAARIASLDQIGSLRTGLGHQNPAPRMGRAALLQRIGHICQIEIGVGPEMVCQRRRVRIERRAAGPRKTEHLEGPVGQGPGLLCRRLLKDHMGIGAADAQRVDAGPARALPVPLPFPVRKRVGDTEGAGLELDRRVGFLVSKARRDLAVMDGQRRLDQARHPCRRIEVADIRLDRADAAEVPRIGRTAEGFGQRRNLDRIAKIGAGAVALDIADAVRRNVRVLDGSRHRIGLPVEAGREIVGLARAVIVDGRTLDHRPDMIAIGHRVLEAAQHHRARARAEDRAFGPVVKGMAFAIRRQHAAFLVEITATLWQLDGDPTGDGHIDLAAGQSLHRVMHCHQRGRARGLDVDRRPREVEDMADPGRQEVLVIAGMAQKEHAGLVDEIRVRADVEIEIAAHAAAGIDTDRAETAPRRVAGILERLPGDLEEMTVLGIKDRRVLGAEPEEGGIERGHAIQRRGGGHIIRAVETGRVLTGGQQLFAVKLGDRGDTGAEVLPILQGRARTRQMRGHANNGDVTRTHTRPVHFPTWSIAPNITLYHHLPGTPHAAVPELDLLRTLHHQPIDPKRLFRAARERWP